MDTVYLSVNVFINTSQEDGTSIIGQGLEVEKLRFLLEVPLETFIVVFVLCYTQNKKVNIVFVEGECQKDNRMYSIPIELYRNIEAQVQHTANTDIPTQVQSCYFPVLMSHDNVTLTAGICSVLRWTIKGLTIADPLHFSKTLLGFRGSCLMACSEVSAWTNFCENDILQSVKSFCAEDVNGSILLPSGLVCFEKVLELPVRTHNILKRKQDIIKSKSEKAMDDLSACTKSMAKLAVKSPCGDVEAFQLSHDYAEGIDKTLADFILFPCVHFLFTQLQSQNVCIKDYLPHVCRWYKLMYSDERLKHTSSIAGLGYDTIDINQTGSALVEIPDAPLPIDNLYVKIPRKSRSKIRGYCISPVIEKLNDFQLKPNYSSFPSSMDEGLDWHSLPILAHPAGGDLPLSRVDRKCQQVESLVTTVMDLAVPNDTIVDFCSGGGHVGILLAYYLPKCTIIMIENKEASLQRARERAEALELDNVLFYQCNLHLFRGNFDIAVALHACGVATDMVINKSLQKRAKFVICPCCYGAIHKLPELNYPRSKKFTETEITLEDFIQLCHCADRTEVDTPSEQEGKYCMGLIDTDRTLYVEEHSYDVKLCTLRPPDCTPKSNLLIGVPFDIETNFKIK